MQMVMLPDGRNIMERRIKSRFSVEYITEVYKSNEILFSTVIDISESGLGILLPGKFDMGEILDLRVNYKLREKLSSESERIDICLKAEIVWIQRVDRRYRAGLSIVDISSGDLKRFKENINKLEE